MKKIISRVKSALGLAPSPTETPPSLAHLKPGKAADASLRRFLMRRRGPVGKIRGYRKRPPLPGGISYAQRRLNFLLSSARQGIEVAKASRAAYVARRSARWKKLVEAELPRQFAETMQAMGMGAELNSGRAADELVRARAYAR